MPVWFLPSPSLVTSPYGVSHTNSALYHLGTWVSYPSHTWTRCHPLVQAVATRWPDWGHHGVHSGDPSLWQAQTWGSVLDYNHAVTDDDAFAWCRHCCCVNVLDDTLLAISLLLELLFILSYSIPFVWYYYLNKYIESYIFVFHIHICHSSMQVPGWQLLSSYAISNC